MLNQFKTSLEEVLSSMQAWKKLRRSWCENAFPLQAKGVQGPWGAMILSKLAGITRGVMLIITADETEADSLVSDLSLYTSEVVQFPWWGSMLYRGVSPQAEIFGRRVSALTQLVSANCKILVTTLRAALGLLPPPQSIRNSLIELSVGGQIDTDEMATTLQRFGYTRVSRVSVPGEFALRGEVVDIAILGEEQAVRVVFNWNKIDELRRFDLSSQVSTASLNQITLHPLREVVWDKETISTLRSNLPDGEFNEVIETLGTERDWRGEEIFYPLAFDKASTLLDYLPDHSVSVFLDCQRLEITEAGMRKEYKELYERGIEQALSLPTPDTQITDFKIFQRNSERNFYIHSLRKESYSEIYDFTCEPGYSFLGNIHLVIEEFDRLGNAGFEIYVFAESESQARKIEYLLRGIQAVHVIPASLSTGFMLPKSKLLAIQENEIFGRKNGHAESVSKVDSSVIDSFVDLEPDDLVVHINYGIGQFLGIKRIKTIGSERDYIAVLYGNEETIFIPIEQVNLIQRYIGSGKPKLDKLGGSSWEKRKTRVKQSVVDLADKLVKLYARRQMISGFAFPKDDNFQVSFEAAFPWQETSDQLTVIREVKDDMESPRPMDRLVCGDVGYGKTEIAMRAAFKSVMGGKQVAYLCPTTILAEQHYENFSERFRRFPVKIAMLSRLVELTERKRVSKELTCGEIDIVIGTHRIFSNDVSFKNLGLLIIDEEQRFGVKDKERLKELKTSVDCLVLSATPIPRTLHMSLVKIRDISLLKTPPSNRRPIETFIQHFEPELVSKSIRNEVERGGQVYYLHNRIESLEEMKKFLEDLVPEVIIGIAHGQMQASKLEDVMYRFVHGAVQVLISTTIIENGIDIPNVNTMIIDRADMYGISQLYQLRGRVGRSNRIAYAYLFYPEGRQISELSMKRLQIISNHTELGSGFKIAMKDMEVRGAGNLLGAEQSGDIYSVGFDLYLKLLENAIRKLTEGLQRDENSETYLELEYSGFIPDEYITDESAKMDIYKKIAAVEKESELERLNCELNDRFGPLPDEVRSLISIAEIRIICKKLRVISLKERKGVVQVKFGRLSIVSVDKVMNMIGNSGGRVKLNPSKPDSLLLETGNVGLKGKSIFIRERLESLL